jgi:Flp pilus assembly pilin Flp
MEFLVSIAKEYGLFVALVCFVLWTNRERENKYIEREEKYIGVIQTLSEEVKERLAKIETIIKRK